MESINITMKNALQFISLIQDICDEKRICLEQMKAVDYELFVTNWKETVKSSEKNEKAIEQISLKQENLEEKLSPEEEEALAMADSLLEKARAVRTKNKVDLKKKVDVVRNYKLKTEVSQSQVSMISKQECLSKVSKECKLTANISHAKNCNNLAISQKTSAVAHSKLLFTVSNSLNKKHKCSSIKKNFGKKDELLFKKSKSTGMSSVCTSMKQMNVEKNQKKSKDEGNCNISNACCLSDSSQCCTTRKNFPPTMKTFKNYLKSKLESEGYILSEAILWYPYLISKNPERIFKGIKCNSFDEFHKTCLLIHKIQETMLYIDLLCLIGKEVLPIILNFEGSYLNKIRLCSYLKSVFDKRSQRTPRLVPKSVP